MSVKPNTPFQPCVLVVDDEPIIRELFRDILSERGIQCFLVEDGKQAIMALAEHSFDLVIADKNLPVGVSGLDLLKQIKIKNIDLDIILVTAYADTASAIEAIRHGVYDYIVKPFESDEDVWQRINRALNKRRLRLENIELLEKLKATNQELENKVAERTRQLEELTLTDDVTGLHNQRFLYQRLPEECIRAHRYGHSLALLMIDIDNFKLVNDSHDHIFGSNVLQRIGELMLENVRSTDICVRYGGDEYCIILPETDLASAALVAERLRKNISSYNVGNSVDTYFVTISIGVIELLESSVDDAKALLQIADRALYTAKNHGRNCVMIYCQEQIVDTKSYSNK
ncbi:MAG: diguanylate cyclase [Deltaproteobacteria bacterium]|nr:diguanylate cyclase [Deltaproteobacteria bacterium]